MKKLYFNIAALLLFIFPLRSINMSLGGHVHGGRTSVNDWTSAPPYTTKDDLKRSDFAGYFIQLLFELKKCHLGFEFGARQLYNSTKYFKDSENWIYRNNHKQSRFPFVIQPNLRDTLFFQFGIGIYPKGSDFRGVTNPSLALMTSLRYHLKLTNGMQIPIFLRADSNDVHGNQIGFSIGTGLVIRWKSGL